MARKNSKCTTSEPVTDAKNPSPACPGTIIVISIPGIPYSEVCLRCGKTYN